MNCIEHSLHQETCTPEPEDEEIVREATGKVWQCPLCDHQFNTIAALKIHAQRGHDKRDTTEQDCDKATHALHGLPICRFCKKSFSRWQTLAHHKSSMPVRRSDMGTFQQRLHQLLLQPRKVLDSLIFVRSNRRTLQTSRRRCLPLILKFNRRQHVVFDFSFRPLF